MDWRLLMVLAASVLVACGKPSPLKDTIGAEPCSPGGIWRAADGTVAIIDQSPRAHIVQPDGVQYVGNLTGVETGLKKKCFLDKPYSFLHVALPLGMTLPGGALEANGTVNGEWKRRQGNLDIWGTLDATSGADIHLSFSGAYDALHAQRPQVAALAGTYHPATDPGSEVVTIDANGVVFSQNATTGCVVNGSIETVDAAYNVYRLDLTYSSCRDAAVVLNGRSAEGLGYFDSMRTPAVLFIALDVLGSEQHYSIVRRLIRI
jgi:hypothetical protein